MELANWAAAANAKGSLLGVFGRSNVYHSLLFTSILTSLLFLSVHNLFSYSSYFEYNLYTVCLLSTLFGVQTFKGRCRESRDIFKTAQSYN